MLVIHTGAVVGRTLLVAPHPRGRKIWLAWVDIGDGKPMQIVFGGQHRVERGDLVPVAPPGVKAVALDNRNSPRHRKMRRRTFRGQPSHGMFCSLGELGWYIGGPDEVAILQDLPVGFRLHEVPRDHRPAVVKTPRCFHELERSDTVGVLFFNHELEQMLDEHTAGSESPPAVSAPKEGPSRQVIAAPLASGPFGQRVTR